MKQIKPQGDVADFVESKEDVERSIMAEASAFIDLGSSTILIQVFWRCRRPIKIAIKRVAGDDTMIDLTPSE